jgi:hypothetical protein
MKYLRGTAVYTWDRLQKQNKTKQIKTKKPPTNCKGVKSNTNFGQVTGIQENMDTARK